MLSMLGVLARWAVSGGRAADGSDSASTETSASAQMVARSMASGLMSERRVSRRLRGVCTHGGGAGAVESLVCTRGHVASLRCGGLLGASGLVVAACGVIGVVYTEL